MWMMWSCLKTGVVDVSAVHSTSVEMKGENKWRCKRDVKSKQMSMHCTILFMPQKGHYVIFATHVTVLNLFLFFFFPIWKSKFIFYHSDFFNLKLTHTDTHMQGRVDDKHLHLQVQVSSTTWRETSVQEAQRGGSKRDTNRKRSRQIEGQIQLENVRLPPVGEETDLIWIWVRQRKEIIVVCF